MGPTGELFEPMGTLTHTDTVAYFAEQAQALAEGGAEVIWIETMSSLEEVAAAAEVCARNRFAGLRHADLRYRPTLHDGRHPSGLRPVCGGDLVWTWRAPTAVWDLLN